MDKVSHLFYDISKLTPTTATTVTTWNYTLTNVGLYDTKKFHQNHRKLSLFRCRAHLIPIPKNNKKKPTWECRVFKSKFGIHFRARVDAFRWAACNEVMCVLQFLKNFGPKFDPKTNGFLTMEELTFGHNQVLRHAAAQGHLSICQFLRDCGSVSGTDGFTTVQNIPEWQRGEVLISACQNGHLHICKFLKEWSLSFKVPLFGHAFTHAAHNGHAHICEFLMQWLHTKEGEKQVCPFPNVDCLSVLQTAVRRGHVRVLQLFKDNGFPASNNFPKSLLEPAAYYGRLHICKFIMDWQKWKTWREACSHGDVLLSAATRGHLHVCQFLLDWEMEAPKNTLNWNLKSDKSVLFGIEEVNGIMNNTCKAARAAFECGHTQTFEFLRGWIERCDHTENKTFLNFLALQCGMIGPWFT